MTTLKQRVPLGRVEGQDVFVTIEWLKDLNAKFLEATGTSTTATTASDPVVIALIAAQADLITALTLSVQRLENRYQS